MDTSGIANDTMLGAQVLKMAVDLQAQTASQLIASVPSPSQGAAAPAPSAPDPTSRLGRHIDVTA